jgi:hypothetical protein
MPLLYDRFLPLLLLLGSNIFMTFAWYGHLRYKSAPLALVATAIVTGNAWWLLAALVCGYGFAWVGHFFFEKNRPATFRHPFYSFAGDWVMFADILRGRVRL